MCRNKKYDWKYEKLGGNEKQIKIPWCGRTYDEIMVSIIENDVRYSHTHNEHN